MTDVRKGRRMLVLIALVFASPILIASLLAFSGWMPAGRRNYGELVDPPQRLQPAATTAAGNALASPSSGVTSRNRMPGFGKSGMSRT